MNLSPRTTFLWIFVHYRFQRPWATVGTKKMATLGAPAYNLVYYSSSLIITVAHRQWLKIPWPGRRRCQVTAERASSLYYYSTCARIIKIIIIFILYCYGEGGGVTRDRPITSSVDNAVWVTIAVIIIII